MESPHRLVGLLAISAAIVRGIEGQQNKLDVVCLVPVRGDLFRLFDVGPEIANDRSIGLALLRLRIIILNSIVASISFEFTTCPHYEMLFSSRFHLKSMSSDHTKNPCCMPTEPCVPPMTTSAST